jgi:hypothetical protein
MILLLNVVMEEDSGACGRGDAHNEGLPDPPKGRRIVDGMMMLQKYLQGGETRAAGPHEVNL